MALLETLIGSSQPRRLLGRIEARERVSTRLPWVLGFMAFWSVLIFGRLIHLQVLEHERYRIRAEHQHTVMVPIPPVRGELLDRRGESLAISLRAESLFCTPQTFYPDYKVEKGEERSWGKPDTKEANDVAAGLAPILGLPKRVVVDRLLAKKPFVWIERQLGPSKAAAVRALNEDSLGFLPESSRHYPRGSLACQVLGFTNIDGKGQLGIEQAYDEQLSGVHGELIAPRDAMGHLLILQENYAKVPVNGLTMQLTIDATIQHIVEDALAEGVRLSHPLTAYAVVVDPGTGEILAMAGTPTFNPNQVLPAKFMNRPLSDLNPAERAELKEELERQKAARKVHPVEDAYEPGSTMKIFTAAIALEERKVHLGEKIDCGPGRWNFGNNTTVSDTHHHGVLTFEEILTQSSNIGAAKLGLRLDPADHYRYLRAFGFGEASGLNFPGETAGRLIAPDRWSFPTQITFSFGYGLSTSPLQILMAGCAVANGGRLMRPYIVKNIFNDQGKLLKETKPLIRNQGKQVISEETSALMREVLKGVITSGTGKKAKLEGVEALGKTGTARKVINGEYDVRRHYASFMGFFPADKPQYGMIFMLDDPQGDVTGGDVAAPLFKKIGDAIWRYRQTSQSADQAPDLKLSLRDWPSSETDEAVVHVERGRVPELKGLALKSAIQRVVMSGGIPQVEGSPSGDTATRVIAQSPEPGVLLDKKKIVIIRVGSP